MTSFGSRGPWAQTTRIVDGPAELVLCNGYREPIHAWLTLSRSLLHQHGHGHFFCNEPTAFEALNGRAWPMLVFSDATEAKIKVREIRTGTATCRCLFEVGG